MKIYRNIVIFLSVIVGIFIAVFLFVASPVAQLAIKEPVTNEHYEMLIENSLTVAKTLDKNNLTDETLTADFHFNENQLVVTVESLKAKVTAKIPIYYSLIDDKLQGTVKIENVEYEKESHLAPAWFYIVSTIFTGAIGSFIFYSLFFSIWYSLFKKK